MASAYSQDLRDRVIDAVVRGRMSRRAAAARFGVSFSSAIKWVQRFERTGSRAASKMGGYLRPRLEPHRELLEALRREKSDITLKSLCDWLLAERGVRVDTSMMSRFFRRLGVTHKKTLIARERDRADITRHRARWRSRQKRVDVSRLVFIDETWIKTNMTRLYGSCPARRAPRRQGPARQMEDRDLPGRVAQRPHRSALCVRRSHQRRALSRLCPAVSDPNAQAQRHRRARQSRIAQRKGGAKGRQGRWSPSPIPSEIFARPQSDRTGLRQDQRLRSKGCAPNARRHLPRHRPSSRDDSASRMPKLSRRRPIRVSLHADRSRRGRKTPPALSLETGAEDWPLLAVEGPVVSPFGAD